MDDLSQKVHDSIERLKAFCPPEGYYLAFSGGKDSVVCKALMDMAELEDNAQIMADHSGLVLVGEPFITNDELSERLKKVVDHWNVHGAETLLGNRTKPREEP